MDGEVDDVHISSITSEIHQPVILNEGIVERIKQQICSDSCLPCYMKYVLSHTSGKYYLFVKNVN
jgi:hypothetical protein